MTVFNLFILQNQHIPFDHIGRIFIVVWVIG